MKFKVTMKDPDTLYDAIRAAVKEEVGKVERITDEEKEGVIERRIESVADIASEWFEYGEYLTVEIDTDAKTCTAVPK